nr:MAG TPA: Minor structural protein 4 [Caudoviricetes sp.]
MTIKIDFDAAHNPQPPTIVLAKKNGDKLGKLNAVNIEITDSMNDASEMSFKVYKLVNGDKDNLWDEIVNFRLVYCVEWNQWFEITVETDEATETVKTVTCTNLGCAELSQINLYEVEINTKDDIARKGYNEKYSTILYRPDDHPEASLLHRILEKAPHYTVEHVDDTIANIQRTFSFDGTSIYDAFQDIAEEINCLFVFNFNADRYGNLKRTISVYDLESNCLNPDCRHRGEFIDVCPKCGGTEIDEGYGDDTTIFVTADELADSINFSTDTDQVKNCFRLEAGDDLMTATVRNCNPNGSNYIWYISEDTKQDMSKELVSAIDAYNAEYRKYQNDHIYLNGSEDIVRYYDALIAKYNDANIYLKTSNGEKIVDSNGKYLVLKKDASYNKKLQEIEFPVKGYPALMSAYYSTIDLNLYLTSGLMPTIKTSDTSAVKEAEKLTASNLSPVAVESIDNISLATANSVVLSMAKVVADSTRYRIKVHDGATLEGKKPDKTRTWTGCFDITNYSNSDDDDDENQDKATSAVITIEINDNYEEFLKQKIDKTLAKQDTDNKTGISELFDLDMSLEDFKKELKKYCLNRLTSFHDACQSCIDILEEQGAANGESWSKDIRKKLHIPYRNRLSAIEAEMKVRQDEIDLIMGVRDADGLLIKPGLQNLIVKEKDETQKILNFQNYLIECNNGNKSLWYEFCSFRRDDEYSNDNYNSTGYNNADLFKKAIEFINVANDEIYKSAELQHSIDADLRNLLLIDKFSPIVNDFKIGNWLRVMVDDKLYKLRLIQYSIDYDDAESLSVEFSDMVRANSTIKSVKDVIEQASSMATSYEGVKRQAKQGEESNVTLSDWLNNGLNTTHTKIVGGSDNQAQTWDNHGMLFRKYDPITGDYEKEQMKIINSTIAITTDNWETTKTAIGKYYYEDKETKELKVGYGVNAETIIGKLFLGENIELSNSAGTLIFDENGLEVSHGKNKVSISPKNSNVIDITNGEESVFKVDENGELTINGNIMARSLSLANGVKINSDVVTNLADVAISGSYTDLINKPSFATVATSGKYADLTGKPSLSTVAISGEYTDLINKPSFATVATSGKYADLTGNISEAGKLLYVDTDGSVTTVTVAKLKTLLGIS